MTGWTDGKMGLSRAPRELKISILSEKDRKQVHLVAIEILDKVPEPGNCLWKQVALRGKNRQS
jgi:hypothetical protein